jgi:hypothetical protein
MYSQESLILPKEEFASPEQSKKKKKGNASKNRILFHRATKVRKIP